MQLAMSVFDKSFFTLETVKLIAVMAVTIRKSALDVRLEISPRPLHNYRDNHELYAQKQRCHYARPVGYQAHKNSIDKADIIGVRRGRFQNEVLTTNAHKYPDIPADAPTIEEIMVFYVKE